MGKKTRKLQEIAQEKEQRFLNLFDGTGSGKKRRGSIGSEILPTVIKESAVNGHSIRDISKWKYKGKSKNKEKQQVELIRHMFANYRVPHFLEQVMVGIGDDRRTFNNFHTWYLAVAQGKSLYKTCTRGILTKKETHLLLQAPTDLTIIEAIWWAKSMAIRDDKGIAFRMSKSAIARRSDFKHKPSCDVFHFFVLNPCKLDEIQELHDYIIAQGPTWSIRKRSLESIRRQSEIWHRSMAKMRTIGGGSWEGLGIDKWTYTTGKPNVDHNKNTERKWEIFEILTGNELAKEGNRMRHCVASYKQHCMSGRTGIFTMRSDSITKSDQRHLTIEVSNSKMVVQARGLANRSPHTQEKSVMAQWAMDNGLRLNRRY